MITEEDLLANGFIKHNSNEIIKKYSDVFYQKKYRDDRGIQYFVNIWHYPQLLENIPESFSPEVDFYALDDDTPWLRIEFLNQSKSVIKLEKSIAALWKDIKAGYYERNP